MTRDLRVVQTPRAARGRLLSAGRPTTVRGAGGVPVDVADVPTFGVVYGDGTTEYRDDDASCRECLARGLCREAVELYRMRVGD